MASVNKVILIGNLGDDPTVRYMPNGDAVANISLATNERWKDKNGEPQEKTEWHRVVVYGKLAEIVAEYLKKGSQAYFEGRIQTRKWTDKHGVEKYTTEIIATQMVMLGSKSDGKPAGESRTSEERPPKDDAKEYAAASGASGKRTPPPKGKTGFEDLEDDIPF